MFFARPEPLELAGRDILALRMSVNTPVVATEELPVGPARAAILVHQEGGIPNVTVAIRSLRTEESIHYSFDGDLGSDSSVAVALDAGLSFAETMGFLFDEEEVDGAESASRERALARWSEVAFGAVRPVAVEDEAREQLLDELANSLSAALGSDGPEVMLELDEEVPAELELAPAGSDAAPSEAAADPIAPEPVAELASPEPAPPEPAPEPTPEAGPGIAPAQALSKFRSPADETPGPDSAPQPADTAGPDRNETTQHALGRLQLVKRRRGRAASSEKPSPILRLLSSF